MTSSEYRNTVYWTLHAHTPADETDLLVTARRIFNNLGVPFPQGTLTEVVHSLSSGDYMGWSICNADLAQQCANNGYPAIIIMSHTLKLILPDEHTIKDNSVASMEHPIIFNNLMFTKTTESVIQYYVFAKLTKTNEMNTFKTNTATRVNNEMIVASTATCSTNCQVVCQSCNVCQSSCETVCQNMCQSSCQTGCQTSCQSTCESVCQGTCQVNCQAGCQVSCQTCDTYQQ